MGGKKTQKDKKIGCKKIILRPKKDNKKKTPKKWKKEKKDEKNIKKNKKI